MTLFTKSLAGSVTATGTLVKVAAKPVGGSVAASGTLTPIPTLSPAQVESGGNTLAVGGFARLALLAPDPGTSRIRVSLVPAGEVDWGTTSEVELEDGFGYTWQETLNDTGTGTVALLNTDPALAGIDYDQALRFYLDDAPVFVSLVEVIDTRTIAPTEEADQVTTITGRGAIAVLDDMAVYPEGGADHLPVGDDRLFFFGQADYDDSGWQPATVQAIYNDATPNWNDSLGVKAPRDYPASGAGYIWNNEGTTAEAPVGTVYFRYTFVLGAAIKIKFYASGDNLWTLWLDGVEIMGEGEDGTTWLDTQESDVIDISAGTHVMAARVTNTPPFIDEFAVAHPNPAFLIVSAWAVNGSDGSESLVWQTDATWRVTGYLDNAPPITAGQIIGTLVAEGVARGCFAPTLTFSDVASSDGFAWSSLSTAGGPIYEFTTNVGDTVLGVLRSLAETYVDFRLRYGSFILDMWDKSGHLVVTPTTFVSGYVDAVNGNLTELRHTGNGSVGALGETVSLPSVAGQTLYHRSVRAGLVPIEGIQKARRVT